MVEEKDYYVSIDDVKQYNGKYDDVGKNEVPGRGFTAYKILRIGAGMSESEADSMFKALREKACAFVTGTIPEDVLWHLRKDGFTIVEDRSHQTSLFKEKDNDDCV